MEENTYYPRSHEKKSIFPKSVETTLVEYNKILTDLNKIIPPNKSKGILHHRILSLEKFISEKLSTDNLARAFSYLHPNWYKFGLPSDTIKDIFIKLESNSAPTDRKYHKLKNLYNTEVEMCSEHGDKTAIYGGLCADCAFKKLMKSFKGDKRMKRNRRKSA